MPVCPQCDNRLFSTKEALLQHMKSSSAWHPFCEVCDRRFTSNAAYDAHMVAKHPVTYDCTICNRSYHAQFALEDHYRGSTAHPNCPVCGKGFRDGAANEEHHHTAHPRVPCAPCDGKIFYEEALDSHYANSPNHPKCKACAKGFKDQMLYAEHLLHSHPELRCDECTRQFDCEEGLEEHYLSSLNHPKCKQCGAGVKDEEALTIHNQDTHTPMKPPPAPEPMEELYSTGFTPLNPMNPAKLLIAGERRSNSPALSLHTNFMSPIKDVAPLFSPAELPRPGGTFEQAFESKENVQISPPATRLVAPERPALQITSSSYSPPARNSNGVKTRPRSESDALLDEAFSPILDQLPDDRFLPPASSSSSAQTFSPPTRFTAPIAAPQRDPFPKPLRGGATFIPRPTLQQSRHFSPPLQFNSRLYPGSVRAAAARAGQSSSTFQPYMQGPSYRSQSTHSLASLSSLGSRDSDNSSLMRTRPPPPISNQSVDWHSLLGNREYTGRGSSKSVLSEAATPKTETPLRHTISLVNHGSLPSPSATRSTSPSSAADYSPPSAYGQTDTRPTTASSAQGPQLLITYPTTASSDCGRSPLSPEVDSPDGLADLPLISPLITTPVDLFPDIPEARRPLPDSPIASAVVSPQTVVFEMDTSHTPSPPPSHSKSSSHDSVVTQVHLPASSNVLQLVEAEIERQLEGRSLLPSPVLTPTVSPVASPMSETKEEEEFASAKPSPIPEWAVDPGPEPVIFALDGEMPPVTFHNEILTTALKTEVTELTSPEHLDTKIPCNLVEAVVASEAPVAIRPATSDEGAPDPSCNPTSVLHCRHCKRETCKDITATMCGHIFCYDCITEQVVKNSRCPVCATPTLLYCLFRLDLKA
ncbi:hypothetical protein BDQ17DRAFT_1305722 [Cyathus striatus]|nr:hypothetical protein BDQ17DRAFT_1305722 [Cyathus striatus]